MLKNSRHPNNLIGPALVQHYGPCILVLAGPVVFGLNAFFHFLRGFTDYKTYKTPYLSSTCEIVFCCCLFTFFFTAEFWSHDQLTSAKLKSFKMLNVSPARYKSEVVGNGTTGHLIRYQTFRTHPYRFNTIHHVFCLTCDQSLWFAAKPWKRVRGNGGREEWQGYEDSTLTNLLLARHPPISLQGHSADNATQQQPRTKCCMYAVRSLTHGLV